MTSLAKLSREELDAEAERVGVEDPEGFATKDEVIAAIEKIAPPVPSGPTPEEQWPAGHNPALVVEKPPRVPVERTYLVCGTQKVHDTLPGGQFTAALAPDQEDLLIWGGHITTLDS
jgi:hypothetical protein